MFSARNTYVVLDVNEVANAFGFSDPFHFNALLQVRALHFAQVVCAIITIGHLKAVREMPLWRVSRIDSLLNVPFNRSAYGSEKRTGEQ